jgi:SAM-dependent methyltransferase
MIDTCRACGGSPTPEIIDGREMMLGLREHFSYRRCSDCRSLWLERPPEDLARYYPDNYYSLNTGSTATGWWSRLRALGALRLPASLVARLLRLPGLRGTPHFGAWLAGLGVRRTDKIGDIGSGAGDVIRQMAACGFADVWGFDPYLPGDLDVDGVHLRRTDIHGVPFGFDLLISNHTLEHLANPFDDLISARQRLVPGAPLVIRVPLADSFAERTYGADWLQLDPPRHLWIPSAAGMRILARRTGFRVQRVFYDGIALALYGSELYRRDVSLTQLGVMVAEDRPPFTAEELTAYKRLAIELNRQRDGDAGGFVLRLSTASGDRGPKCSHS